jgi:hypothetical protein
MDNKTLSVYDPTGEDIEVNDLVNFVSINGNKPTPPPLPPPIPFPTFPPTDPPTPPTEEPTDPPFDPYAPAWDVISEACEYIDNCNVY